MSTKDYVSFETAKLLKKKGFDEICHKKYNSSGDLFDSTAFTYGPKAPTQSQVMKWLREVHNLCVAPYAAAFRYGFTIDKADTGSNIGNEKTLSIPNYSEITTWEEACEAGIKYCLKNLI